METWKDITGYEGVYQVSNLGRVKRLNWNNSGQDKIIGPRTDRNGYLYVRLKMNYRIKFAQVHRLVAQAFIPNPDNKP